MEHLPRSSPSMSEDANAVDHPPGHSPNRSPDRSPFASLPITFSLRFTHHGASRPQTSRSPRERLRWQGGGHKSVEEGGVGSIIERSRLP
ncbi:hypothetical protein AcW1_005088 [Taiwanofungus camphoratus]|nr:hypothetical protein AcW1_005088 [Antrodia cinnamomea]